MKLVALSGLFASLAGLNSPHQIMQVIAVIGVVTNSILWAVAMFSTTDDE